MAYELGYYGAITVGVNVWPMGWDTMVLSRNSGKLVYIYCILITQEIVAIF